MSDNNTFNVDPLEPLLSDPSITEIMVNGYKSVYVERRGVMEAVEGVFQNEEQLYAVIHSITQALGRRIDESSPIVDLRFEDSSRMHIIIPPIAVNGPAFVIRKLMKKKVPLEKLVEWDAASENMLAFLRAAVQGRLNMVISGGTGAGKTTILQMLADLIPKDERVIVVEFGHELQLDVPNQVRLEYRPPNLEGRGEISLSDLVISTLRMRPDRIILGEMHGEEALHLIQAMNTGHDGAMSTLHANSPHDALARMEVMATMANPSIPLLTTRQQITSCLDLIVHTDRGFDGQRRITRITEVAGMQGGEIEMRDIFEFEQTGYADKQIGGYFTATGIKPAFLSRFEGLGIQLDDALFMGQSS